MVSVAFLMGGRVALDAAVVTAFRAQFPAIRDVFEQAAEWIGDPTGKPGQAALVLGMHDTLVQYGIRPHAVGGLSLGSRISACLAGALDRRDLFAMLHHERLIPPPVTPQGLAALMIPGEDDPADYHLPARPGIHLACDHGVILGGTKRRLLVGGTREALEQLTAELPPEVIRRLDIYEGAIHTPLWQSASDFMTPFIGAMRFRDPTLTLCVPNETRTLRTAGQVRDHLIGDYVTPVRMPPLARELERIGTRSALTLGPGFAPGLSLTPMESAHLTEPGDLHRIIQLHTGRLSRAD